jgi:hypothetical protein
MNVPFSLSTLSPAPIGKYVPQFDPTTGLWTAVDPVTLISGTPNTVPYFDAGGVLTETPTFLTALGATGFFLVGATASDNGSSARVQNTNVIANAPQFRSNQYGNNAGVPGLSTFKSRNAVIGGLTGLLASDPIMRITSVGVAPDNASIPLASFITVQVPANFVPAGQNWLPSEYELQLVPLAGPINSRRVVFKVSSEGETQTLRGVRAGGPATLPANLTTGALFSAGAGNPNGTITGSPGDVWSDQTNGVHYVKQTGIATNTGWTALAGKTIELTFLGSTNDVLSALQAAGTLPTTGIAQIDLEGVGGGGGGGGGQGGGAGNSAGGGGAAPLARETFDFDLSHRLDIIIGNGGAPGAAGAPGVGHGTSGTDGQPSYASDFTAGSAVLVACPNASGGHFDEGGGGRGGAGFPGGQFSPKPSGAVPLTNGFVASGGAGVAVGGANGFNGASGFSSIGNPGGGVILWVGGIGGVTNSGAGGGGGGQGPYGNGGNGGAGGIAAGPLTAGQPGLPGGANTGAGGGGGGGGANAADAGGPGGAGGSGRIKIRITPP